MRIDKSLGIRFVLAAVLGLAVAATGCGTSGDGTGGSGGTGDGGSGGSGDGGSGGSGGSGGTGGGGGEGGMGGMVTAPSTMVYTGPITVDETTVLKFLAAADDGGGGMGGMGGGVPLSVSADPTTTTFGAMGTIATDTIQVTLSATGEGGDTATIYYTTDATNVEVPDGAGGAGGAGVMLKTEQQMEGYTFTPSATSADWAESGHGSILKYPWRFFDPYGSVWADSRGGCVKCHSAEGLLQYADTGANPDSAPLPLGLDCSGCHQGTPPNTIWDENATYTFLDPVAFPSTDEASFNNNSNICMTCHQGRSSTPQVNAATPNDVVQAPTDYASYGFVDIHYYAAAAVLFGTDVQGGYEYDHDPGQGGAGGGPAYADQNTFPGPHGSLNDCVECHMNADSTDDKNHTFKPKVSDCATGCHTDTDGTFPGLSGSPQDNYNDIQTLLGELLLAIEAYADAGSPGLPQASPVEYSTEHPYWLKAGTEDPYPDFDFKMLTAAYNYHLAIKEPAGYIHNGDYILQLLFDSILEMGGAPSVTPPLRAVTPP